MPMLPYKLFPTPFLSQLEPYLDDEDLSKMARSAKRHLILCYLRISKLLSWGAADRLAMTDRGIDFFPGDAFLQMQIAKCSGFDTLSFAEYMAQVCFIDADVIFAKFRLAATPLKVSLILNHDRNAKAGYYLQHGDYEAYVRCRQTSHPVSYLTLAMDICASEEADPRFLIKEAELAMAHNHDVTTIIWDYLLEPETWSTSFTAFEHKSFFDFLQDHDLMPLEWFSYDLLTNPNDGLARCRRMMSICCFNNEELLENLPFCQGSFWSREIDPSDENSVRAYVDMTHEDDILNDDKVLIEYE
ncbi:MAG: hypothetical protein H0X02_08515, partial [Nitrosomonas sp.]|nr:hypothetical protein [Nitrosomonas sp.]